MSDQQVISSKPIQQQILAVLPGIGIVCVSGLAALFISEHYGAPAMLMALLLGMAMSFLHEENTKCVAGIEFASCHLLRIGVSLLGLRIALGDLMVLGWQTFVALAVAIFSTITLGLILSKVFQLQKRFGVLTGGAVAICGASAALAISSIFPPSQKQESDTLVTVIGVTAMSTLAMVLYPILAESLLANNTAAGVFIGGTIHDVAQVVGAGYSVSNETGDIATLTKLVRVAMLLPVVLIIILVLKMTASNLDDNEANQIPSFPLFLLGFIALMLINSLVDLPEVLTNLSNDLSRFLLIISITAIGMKSNFAKLSHVGIVPVIFIGLETLWIAIFIFLYVMIGNF